MAIHTLRDCNWADSTVWLEELGSFLAPQFFVGEIDDWLRRTIYAQGVASFCFSTVLSSLLSRPLMEEVIITCGGLPDGSSLGNPGRSGIGGLIRTCAGIMVAELQAIRPSSS
ncbi:hypothetical protein NC651_018978 [Populus alba x Populus x berolinensis]|nr:hypothetical protein NC651_018978 [Populus alba x Populus x berolinensis]